MNPNGYYWQRLALLTLALSLTLVPLKVWCQSSDHTTSMSGRPLELGFESDLVSRYVWRGLEFSAAGVWQQTLWLSAGAINASVWTNCDPESGSDSPAFNEVDISLGCELPYRLLTFEPSIQTYLYPDQPTTPSTAEFSLNIAATLPIVSPFMKHTFDIREYTGSYFGEFGLCFEQSLGRLFTFDAVMEIGWASVKFNTVYAKTPSSGVQLYQLESGIACYLTGSFYIRPNWCWTYLSPTDLRNAVERPLLLQIGIVLGGQF